MYRKLLVLGLVVVGSAEDCEDGEEAEGGHCGSE